MASDLIKRTSQIIGKHFQEFERAFEQIAIDAKRRFIQRDWKGQRRANVARISLHKTKVEEAYREILSKDALPPDEHQMISRLLDHFISNFADDSNAILAYGFMDALLRKVLYHHRDFEQVYTTREYPFDKGDCRELRQKKGRNLRQMISKILQELDLAESLLVRESEDHFLEKSFQSLIGREGKVLITYLPNLFYRNQHAYLLGKIQCGDNGSPFAIAIINPPEGIMADALLSREPDIKRIFAFSRSYLINDTSDPWGMIHFLLQLMPSKTEEQLIINLGYLDAGRHRMLQKLKIHLRTQETCFDYAPGIAGMVMLVFCLPEYPLVFKLIRDDIRPPKSIRKEQVLRQYDFVAKHDRAGRLADVQLYEYLVLPRAAFEDKLLEDLKEQTAESVMERGDYLVLKHVFVEKKMRPLNLYLQEASEQDQKKATLDYGNAIREMAMINIFPGDLLIKNFGVTRDQRVVFYDYDEVTTLQDCEFRKMPEPRYEDEIMSAEPWFSVNDNDVFPEEFASFVVPRGPLFDMFQREHGDIFKAEFWNYWKEYYASGKVLDLQPYGHSRYEENGKG